MGYIIQVEADVVKVGCCGFPMGLEAYIKRFDAVEVQISFYRRLTEKQLERWRRAAPKGFTFTLKAPQCATHPPNSPTYRRSHLSPEERRDCGYFKLTDVVKREVEDAFEKAKRLGAEIMLFQTPPSFKPTPENLQNMERFFAFYRGAMTFAWEPRGKEWCQETVRSICRRLGLIHATDPFLELPPQTDTIYFRMHGDLKTYRYSYSEEELNRLRELVRGKEGFVFFNNSAMAKDAERFRNLAGGSDAA